MKYLFFALLSIGITNAQSIINEKLAIEKDASFTNTIVKVGQSFLGTKYEARTLEGAKEVLVCKLDGLDCYTFVENVLAISGTIMSDSKELTYKKHLLRLRYRNNKIEGYASRIHYFSDWASHAETLGYLENISRKKGELLPKTINFMSTHRKSYAAFATDNWMWSQIQKMEQGLESNKIYHSPKNKFDTSYIKNGDILAFTSTVEGLDVNHEGFAFWENGTLKLMHASLEKKMVIISTESVQAYMDRIPKHGGVMVLRPKYKAL